jgi:hypothetical protein
VSRFARELAAGIHTRRVREDFMSGVRSGVNGTPTFYINNIRYDGGHDAASLIEGIELALDGSPGMTPEEIEAASGRRRVTKVRQAE